ncbi:ABC transporter substrate-binding protein [Ornithinibacillus sp. L9]|uniref:ABC transporter substrate-binding protein n=1 Tax=Ornithinibacillus caprae TaxID=2678566 RepID=A0A6N8FJT0_9BACI|nr:Fe(3+) dicitrate ABC transporter substrate-binding protein [Ornithinibacillus caprae]MUK88237.1 ABC transporter substrate-binding protein [Ornithinibacillus caprae]
MNRKSSLWFVVIAILALILSACGSTDNNSDESSEESGDERIISHEMGETPISGSPERIVVLEFSFVDALASLGITPVGIADDDDSERIIGPIAEQIGEYTSVGTRKEPSVEIISSLQPDLIIADINRHKDVYEKLSEIAPTIVLSSLSSNYEENVDSFSVIAEALGETEKAEQRLAQHEDTMSELKSNVPENESRTILPAVVTDTGFHAHSSTSYTGSLLESLGFENAIQGTGIEDATNKIDLETLVESNPDIMFFMTSGGETIVSEWQQNPLWEEISAVQNGHVYEVDQNEWSRFRGLIAAELIVEQTINHLYK